MTIKPEIVICIVCKLLIVSSIFPVHLSAAPIPKNSSTTLMAIIKAGSEPDTVDVEYSNDTAQSVSIDQYTIKRSVIVLEVIDSTGEIVPPVPPSIPPAKRQQIVIASGGKRTETYSLLHFSDPLPPGKYRVRVRLKGWATNEFLYEVRKAKK